MTSVQDECLLHLLLKGSTAPTLLCPIREIESAQVNDAFSDAYGQDAHAISPLLEHGRASTKTTQYDLRSRIDGITRRFVIELLNYEGKQWVFAKGIELDAEAPDQELKTENSGLSSLLHKNEIKHAGFFYDDYGTNKFHASDNWYPLLGIEKPEHPCSYAETISSQLSKEQCTGLLARRERAIRDREAYHSWHGQFRATPQQRSLITNIHIELDDDGTPVGAFGITMEIPELRNLTYQLEHEREVFTKAQHIAKVGHIHDNLKAGSWHASETFFELIGREPLSENIPYDSPLDEEVSIQLPCIKEKLRRGILSGMIPARILCNIKHHESSEEVNLEISVYPEHNATGEIVGYFSIVVDVTDSQKLSKSLTLEKNLHLQAQEVAKFGHFILDPDTFKVEISPVLLNLTGLDKSNVPKTYHELMRTLTTQKVQKDSEQRLRSFLIDPGPHDVDIPIIRADTGEHRIMHLTAQADIEDQKIRQIIGTARDVTEERQLQSTLEYERHLFSRAQEFARIGHFIDDLRNETFYASDMLWELVGLSAEEELPATHDEMLKLFLSPTERAFIDARREKAQKDGKPYGAQVTVHVKPSDQPRQFWTEVIPEIDEDGVVTSFFGIVQDITDRLEAERSREQLELALQEAQKMEALNYFAGGMAHELGNFLQPALNFAALTQSAVKKGDTQSALHYTERVLAAVTRASDVTRRALKYVRKAPTKPESIRLGDAIQDARTILGTTAPILEWHIEPGIQNTRIIADGTGLLQVLLNLVRNAIESGEELTRIDIRFRRTSIDNGEAVNRGVVSGEYLRITVFDDGPGISEAVQKTVFDPFVTSKSSDKGTGLGLPVSKGLTERWGGTLYLASTGDWGSSFEILIPISSDN